MTNLADATQATMALVERHAAHNYSPLPVVAASAEGAWIADIDGLRYLDWLAAYSAVNLGHRNPASTATAHAQVDTVTLLNRALHADRLGPLGAALAQLCGKDVVLPMNSDAEAVESGLRVARKWGADVNGLPAGRHDIILANNNFHGHTSSVVSFSSDPAAGSGVEPSTRDSARYRLAMLRHRRRQSTTTPSLTCSSRFLARRASSSRPTTTCRLRRAQRADDRRRNPIGAGLYGLPVRLRPRGCAARHLPARQDTWWRCGSVVGDGRGPRNLRRGASRRTRVDVRRQSVGRRDRYPVVSMVVWGECQARSAKLGAHLHQRLADLIGDGAVALRGLGWWADVDIERALAIGTDMSMRLADRGVLLKDTYGAALRFAPPLVITAQEIDCAVRRFADALWEAGS